MMDGWYTSCCWFLCCLLVQAVPEEVVEYHPTVFAYVVLVLCVLLMSFTFIFLALNKYKCVLV